MKTVITVCDTCKTEGFAPNLSDKTDGQNLLEHIQSASKGQSDITVRSQSCLMGCERACNIAIQGPNKLHYVLGGFEPSAEAAQAIFEYAKLYTQSDTGQVPYKTWPQAIKGHFVARLPPIQSDTE